MTSNPLVELRPDPLLLNPDFENYILSGRKVVLTRIPIEPAKLSALSPSQFGYQHGRLFSDSPRLVQDTFVSAEDHLYLFTAQNTLVKVVRNPARGISTSSAVTTLSASTIQSESYPPGVIFPDCNFAIVWNGFGLLSIYKTGKRSENEKWELEYEFPLTSPNDPSTQIPSVVADARSQEPNRLSILLQTVAERSKDVDEQQQSGQFYSKLYWLDVDMTSRQVTRRRDVDYKGNLDLATLNSNATELVTLGASKPRFTFDSAQTELDDMDTEEAAADPLKPVYVWSQDAEEIKVKFALAEKVDKRDVVYDLKSNVIRVQVKGILLLNGKLEGPVHFDSSTWTIENDILELTLFKARGHFWRELVPGDGRGHYQPSAEGMRAALAGLERFTAERTELACGGGDATFNAAQLEECDAADGDATAGVPRLLHWSSGRPLQTADLGATQLLFRMRLRPGGPLALCARHEHDGIVWSLDAPDLPAGARIAHKHTLNAFGYVQASHSNKVGSGCAPDGSFAFVCHLDHHLFVYLQSVPVPDDFTLKNRKSGKTHPSVAEHLVVNTAAALEPSDRPQVLGFVCTSQNVYVLTETALLCAQAQNVRAQMSLRVKLRRVRKNPPEGWDIVEPTLEEFERRMREAESDPHEGKRKTEATWPIFRIHHQRSRYIYDLFWKEEKISRELYQFCIDAKLVDAQLMAKWKKQGFEQLCCLRCVQVRDTNFGTNCICRVPKSKLEADRVIECVHCGCRGCSG